MNKHETAMARAIDWLVAHYDETPSLGRAAEFCGMEATYFQKIFKDYVGISPKQFIRYMGYRHARELLVSGQSTLQTALDTGLSSQSRLHDMFVSVEAMTPGGVAGRGRGIVITYGFAPTFLGEMMVAKTDLGICWLGFQVDESRQRSLARMHDYWPAADFVAGDVRDEINMIAQIWRGQGDRLGSKLKIDLYGTNMQLQVWQALLKIPFGCVSSYKDIAKTIDKPSASRAVGGAVGMNPVSLLIPCHRVIQSSGVINNYGWGSPRKKAILGVENHLYDPNKRFEGDTDNASI